MIKKYNHQTDESQWQYRLRAYAKQAQTYRQQTSNPIIKNLKKGTLTALIPLAAATAANAQCQGVQATVSWTGANRMKIDIDGGGDDFTFTFSASTLFHLKGVGSNGFIAQNNSVRRLSNGYAITTAKNFTNNEKNLCNSGGSQGQFNTGHSSTDNYIGIKKGTKLGFIRLTVIDCSASNGDDMSFRIDEMGYENDGNSAVTAGDCATLVASLPVEMTYFRSTVIDNHIQLQWATATEINNSGFEIQRSTDGRLFHKVGWIAGHGTTNDLHEYIFADENIQPNINYYYRIKQVDYNGDYEFSPIENNMIKNADLVEVSEFYPNLITKDFPVTWINMNIPEAVDGSMQVFDSRGTVVKTLNRHFDVGQNRFSLRLEDVPAGQYFVKLQIGERHEYRRLVVQ